MRFVAIVVVLLCSFASGRAADGLPVGTADPKASLDEVRTAVAALVAQGTKR